MKMMDYVCCLHVVPTLTLDNIYTYLPGVGNLDHSKLRYHLGDDTWSSGRSSVDVVLREWLAGNVHGPPSWKGLHHAIQWADVYHGSHGSHGSHGWEQIIKFCAPEGKPNYIPIIITYTVLYC